MRSDVRLGDAPRKRCLTLAARGVRLCNGKRLARFRQNELRLPRPDQINVNFRQQFGVEQCAVLGAA